MEQSLAIKDELNVAEITQQVTKIQEIMQAVMRDGEHYGTIPGTNKPSLLKPGAEKLGFTFRLVVDEAHLKIEEQEMGGGHRNFRVICPLIHAPTGTPAGAGIGSCNTMETRYRYRNEFIDSGEPIPNDYKQNKGAYKAKGMVAKKINDEWKWGKQERMEHDNPADYYNTCEKMAKKRAFVDAILTATAASDFFTQDMEDIKANAPAPPPPPKEEKKQDDSTDDTRKITEKQRKRLFAISKQAGLSEDDVKKVIGAYGYDKTSDITMNDYEKICNEIELVVVPEESEQEELPV